MDGAISGEARRLTTLRTLARLAVPITLFALLIVLVVVPFGMLIYTSVVDAPPFASGRTPAFTLANFAALWQPANARALVNTLVVSAIGTVLAMGFGCGM